MSSSVENSYRAIVITGTLGSGKSTTTNALVDVLAHHNIPNAGIDMDFLRRYSPIPSDDPFGVKVGLANLSSIAANYRDVGINMLVLADVITSSADATAVGHALEGYCVHIVRIRVPQVVFAERLRHRESAETINWYLERAPELQNEMDTNDVGDIVIDISDEHPEQIAEVIAAKLNLI